MAEYRKIESKPISDVSEGRKMLGTLYKVELIPEFGESEIQDYFVREGEDVDNVLQEAADNHERVLRERKEEAEENLSSNNSPA